MVTPTELIDNQIADFPDWRGEMMTQLRKLVHSAVPDIKEEWKWGTGVYTKHTLICAINAFKDHVKINFFKGALLEDPHKLFNGGLESKQNRSIDFHEGDKIKHVELKKLIKAAVPAKS